MSKAKAEITIYHIIDISKVTRYYKLQSSTTTKPSKPTTNPPSGWTTTEPSYTEGSTNSLYTVDLTIFSDDSWSYSEVSLSSSYEAAKAAYNKAHALVTRVTSAETNIDQNKKAIELKASKTEVTTAIRDITIGGRNLAVGTSNEWIDISVNSWSGALNHTVNDVTSFTHSYSDYGLSVGDWITFSIDLKAVGKQIAIRVDYANDNGSSARMGNYIQPDETGRSILTLQALEEYSSFKVYVGSDGTVSESIIQQYKRFKVEKGTKATDWTPAPEDMATREDVTSLNTSFTVEAEGIKSEVSSVKASVNENEENIARANSLIEQLDSRILTIVRDENGTTRLVQTSTGWEYDFSALVGAVQNHSDRLNNYDDKIKLGSYVNEKGETEPSIEFSENSTDFKVIITNRRVLFQEGGNTPTYIYDNTLVTENIEIKQELRQGGWVEEIRNNCKCLVWKGVTK